MSLLSKALPILKGAAKITGLLKKEGQSGKVRTAKLVTSGTALLVALFSWVGLPPEVAEPLAQFLVDLGLTQFGGTVQP